MGRYKLDVFIILVNHNFTHNIQVPDTGQNNHCPNSFDLMTPFGDTDLGQHWLKKGLLPDGTKPLLEPLLIYHE